MTKRDFQLVADAVKNARAELEGDQAHDGPVLAESQWDYVFGRVIDNLASKLSTTNPAFNAAIFKKACS